MHTHTHTVIKRQISSSIDNERAMLTAASYSIRKPSKGSSFEIPSLSTITQEIMIHQFILSCVSLVNAFIICPIDTTAARQLETHPIANQRWSHTEKAISSTMEEKKTSRNAFLHKARGFPFWSNQINANKNNTAVRYALHSILSLWLWLWLSTRLSRKRFAYIWNIACDSPLSLSVPYHIFISTARNLYFRPPWLNHRAG